MSEPLPPLDQLLPTVPQDVVTICQRLRQLGHRGWIVGGCVRDLFMGRPASDWDVATDARPEQVSAAFRRVIPTGIKHGTVTILLGPEAYEVTTLRGEGAYQDGRHPSEVVFLDDIVEDLARRDFTFNALAIDPLARQLIDPFEGRQDLANRVVRAVGEPLDRFTEDGLRLMRAARFAATLECTIEPTTLRAMSDSNAHQTLRQVSVERVREEWFKTMKAPQPSVAFNIMRDTSLQSITCPELKAAVGCQQNRWHNYDVWDHTMACVDACKPDPILRVAALLHDVAKPQTRAKSDKTGDYTFYNHEAVGATVADTILRRLKFSNEQRKRIVELVRHHLICYAPEWTDAAVRRWIRRVTPELVDDLFELGIADGKAKGKEPDGSIAAIEQLRVRVSQLMQQGAALSVGDLALNGHVLMKELDLPPGKHIGRILATLVELVTDEPAANERQRLLRAAREWLAANEQPPQGDLPPDGGRGMG